MFTGIIEEMGTLKARKDGAKSSTLTIQASKVLEGTQIGDTIATNGVCLTVTGLHGDCFDADVMAETIRRTNLGDLKLGNKLNLERALSLNTRLGGHIVSGHIDGTVIIKSFEKEDNAVWITVEASEKILHYIIEKGSITIDGVSLTVAYVDDSVFKVSIIPHTASVTILLSKKTGDTVNLENDIIGKYVEKLLKPAEPETKKDTLSMEFLSQHGFI